ncbi:MAG TPA: 2-oxoacid:acceptor oxidoreductase subunit alpha [Chloroflexota bacterium]|nr:2-oxoacid:acceptor oxidoreductase subunit alpha [Chloroflexota bacterium]
MTTHLPATNGAVPGAAAPAPAPAPAPARALIGTFFMNGDIACAEGAIAAGCNFFGGYPITPSTEIAERMARRLPEAGGVFLQMEDELASIGAVLGASWAGSRAMTATSGPGFTLMLENIGWGMLTETPCVVVDVQRGGPATGLPTLVSQGDVMQAKWGSHGDYEPVAYAPASAQEMFDLTVTAFSTAELLRQPVFVMADEIVGHTTERVTIPPAAELAVPARRRPGVPPPPRGAPAGDGERFLPFAPGPDLVPPMARAGDGYRLHVTGLTHDERGYPSTNAQTHDRLVRRLTAKVAHHAPALTLIEEAQLADAEVAVVAYGSTSRSARRAIALARQSGIRAGLLRPITLWPFPAAHVEALGRRGIPIVVPELNLGQYAREIERHVGRRVHSITHGGGALLTPQTILDGIRQAASNERGGARRS